MYLYFEEDGSFKAGTVLAQSGNAYQVELVTGRRTKVKQNHTFFTFRQPTPAQLVRQSAKMMAELDPDFLWEVAPDEEFHFDVIAKEYWGRNASPVERAATLQALHANPVYFYRKARGSYRRAPADVLKMALAALERKRQQDQIRQGWVNELLEGRVPEEIQSQVMPLLVQPDKNSLTWKALQEAARKAMMSPLRLMLKLGAVPSPWYWHVQSFWQQNFPRGRKFPVDLPEPNTRGWRMLPVAEVEAFSIDDSSTTEIDDALSVTKLGDGRVRVGVHIAAPSFGIAVSSPLDRVARARMSTIYAPGLKTTMLPRQWYSHYSLDEGRRVPCVSLYITADEATYQIEKTETRVERITVAKNLRHDALEELVTAEAIESKTLDVPYAEQLSWLWYFAKHLLSLREEVRGRPCLIEGVDWYFALEGEGEDAKILLKGRRRGAPLDLLVAELMIYANCTWGLWLEEHDMPSIYRAQRMGRVRMTTSPSPHDGLGVLRYAWSTSPLRRYVDLFNQRQIIAAAMGYKSAFKHNDTELFTIVSQFENLHAIYGDFQTRMERYWSLRWILQEGLKEIEAIVVKGDLVRIDGLPFMQRVPGLPEDLARGRKVLLQILGCDLVDLVMDARLVRVLDEQVVRRLDDRERTSEEIGSERTSETPTRLENQP